MRGQQFIYLLMGWLHRIGHGFGAESSVRRNPCGGEICVLDIFRKKNQFFLKKDYRSNQCDVL